VTEYEIKESQIPKNILIILNSNFTDYALEGAEIAETISGKSYEFEIEQGKEEFKVLINSQGNLTKKKKSREEKHHKD